MLHLIPIGGDVESVPEEKQEAGTNIGIYDDHNTPTENESLEKIIKESVEKTAGLSKDERNENESTSSSKKKTTDKIAGLSESQTTAPEVDYSTEKKKSSIEI